MSIYDKISKPALASAAAGLGILAYTWRGIPEPYPPMTWSRTARSMAGWSGLGPFQYYSSEKGATTPIDRVPASLIDRVGTVDRLKCMKPGLDSPSSVGEYVSGLVMVDEGSYTLMANEVALVRERLTARATKVVPESKIPKSHVPVFVSLKRNLAGKPFASYIPFDDRRAVEATVMAAMEGMGTYHPLPGSQSSTRPMSTVLQDVLRSRGLIFEAPWTTYELSTGCGRHWPDARGVCLVPAVDGTDVAVWVNREDHVEVVGVRADGDLEKAYAAVASVADSLETKIKFAKDPASGYLTSRPEDAGTGLQVSATLDLTRVSRHPSFHSLCRSLRLNPIELNRDHAIWNLVSVERFGLTPTEAIERTESAIAELMRIESSLRSAFTARDGEARIANLVRVS